jgi:hypothetical protein
LVTANGQSTFFGAGSVIITVSQQFLDKGVQNHSKMSRMDAVSQAYIAACR